ncbi:relaxase domain-containing protein [Burkholderia vietnamiensis]|uniref:ATP-dependent exoDNAse (Exonuclease V) alpha subunit-helicase superfamily I member-like protein n=1 Tax=Burkholderia vietnamiensis (strain G4 / LMG 22486) TaxID=269482 RepID=A4JFK5_BURVG|nr:ATP-dependent exoDNAse (exonuclease V) alpha subunit - helicase superfamily I member-like protein [Burkholderia vietnamiensis G4]MCB4344818.1 relaxase domain-containing protein [Burkholderia vietnamiensis]
METISRLGREGAVDKHGKSRTDYLKDKELANCVTTLNYYLKRTAQREALASQAQANASPAAPQSGAMPLGAEQVAAGSPVDAVSTQANVQSVAGPNGQRRGMNYLQVEGAPFDAELLPQWHGKVAQRLGLQDPTDSASLEKMFEQVDQLAKGFAPNTGGEGVHGAGADHMIGWDVTFSMIKPPSIMMVNGGDAIKKEIYDIHHEAVTLVMEFIEKHVIMTRFGQGGKIKSKVEGIAAAMFSHRASRDWDPQLHTHVVLFNAVSAINPDGEHVWRTIDAKTLYAMKMATGALYRSHVAKRFAELGFIIERTGKKQDTFTLAGFPTEAVEQASKRAAAIDKLLDEKGLTDAHAKQKSLAKLATRKPKDEPPYPELLQHWRDVEGNYGWSPEKTQELLAESRARREAGEVPPFKYDRAAILERVTEHEAAFLESDLIHAIAIESVGHWGIDQVVAEAKAIQSHINVIPLQQDAYGRKLFTTPKMLGMEKFIQNRVGVGLADRRHHVPKSLALAHLREYEKKEGLTLKIEQREAAVKALSDSGTVAIIKGAAGTGKTTVAKGIARTFELAGSNVFGTAISSGAAAILGKEAGIESFTVADLLSRLERGEHKAQGTEPPKLPLGDKSVLFVDESGMIDTRSMHKLMGYQKEIGFKMVWFGDTRQLAPVAAGNVQLTTEANYGHLNSASMSEITRQKEEWMRQTVLRSMNAPQRAFKINARGETIDSKGQPTINPAEKIPLYRSLLLTPEQRKAIADLESGAVERYLAQHDAAVQLVAVAPGGALDAGAELTAKARARALAPVDAPAAQRKEKLPADPESAARINGAIRAKLREQGHLGAVDFALTVEKAAPGISDDTSWDGALVRQFAEGERIRFTHPIKELGIARDAMAVIRSLREESISDGRENTTKLIATVQLDARAGVAAQVLDIDLTTHHDIDHGYCVRANPKELAESQAVNADLVVEALHRKGRLHIINQKREDEIARRLVTDWLDAVQDWPGAKPGPDGKPQRVAMRDKLMLAGENRSVSLLNEIAREELKKRGELRGKDFQFLRPDDGSDLVDRVRSLAVGERIVFTKPLTKRAVGHRITNGARATIEDLRLNAKGDVLMRARLDPIDPKAASAVVTINLSEHNAIDHGYGSTIHRAQGATADKAFALHSSAMGDSRWCYVTLSRARFGTQFYAAAQEIGEMREDLGLKEAVYKSLKRKEQWEIDQVVQRMALAEVVGRDGVKHSAIDYPLENAADDVIPLIDRYEPVYPDGWTHEGPMAAEAGASAHGASQTQSIAPAQDVRTGADVVAAVADTAAQDRALAAVGEPLVLVAHGAAPHHNRPDGAPSYFVMLRDAQGHERTEWGPALERVVAECGLQPGDVLGANSGANISKRPVSIRVKVRDTADPERIVDKLVGVQPQELLRAARETLRAQGLLSLSSAAPVDQAPVDAMAVFAPIVPVKNDAFGGQRVCEALATEAPVTVQIKGHDAADLIVGIEPRELLRAARQVLGDAPARALLSAAQTQPESEQSIASSAVAQVVAPVAEAERAPSAVAQPRNVPVALPDLVAAEAAATRRLDTLPDATSAAPRARNAIDNTPNLSTLPGFPTALDRAVEASARRLLTLEEVEVEVRAERAAKRAAAAAEKASHTPDRATSQPAKSGQASSADAAAATPRLRSFDEIDREVRATRAAERAERERVAQAAEQARAEAARREAEAKAKTQAEEAERQRRAAEAVRAREDREAQERDAREAAQRSRGRGMRL